MKKIIIVNSYDDTHSTRRKFTKKNPDKVVTKIKMLPIFESGNGRKAEITYKKR